MKRDPKLTAWILLASYSFDHDGKHMDIIIENWLSSYPGKWVIAAIVEAIYQGRYKVSSVSKILESWAFRGYPTHHFDHEFADIVCKKLANCKDHNLFIMNQNKSPKNSKVDHQEEKNITGSKYLEMDLRNNLRTPNPKIKKLEKLVVKLTA